MARFNVIYGLPYGSRLKVGSGLATPRYYVLDRNTGKAVARFADPVSARRRAEYRNGKETPLRASCEDCGPSQSSLITTNSVRPLGVGDVVSFVGEDWTITAGPYPLSSGKPGYDLERASGTKVRGISVTSVKRKD